MNRFLNRFAAITAIMMLAFSPSAQAEEQDYNSMVMHHIGNANEFHVFGDIHIPLPCILYAKDAGLSVFMSSKFHHGADMVDGYVLDHGVVRRVIGLSDAMKTGVHHLGGIAHDDSHDEHEEASHSEAHHDDHGHEGHDHAEHAEHSEEHHDDAHASEGHATYIGHKEVDGKQVSYVSIGGNEYMLEKASTLLAFTSWFDFSISKNVFSMLLAFILLLLIFTRIAKAYKTRKGQAPKGIQSFFEPIVLFVRDEIARPAIGPKYEKFMPFIMSLFFFIMFNNLLGLIPFFPGSANVTGNVGATLALALFTFFVVNLNGNKHYWEHILWMPGVPVFVKPILAILEVIGLFTKPFTLFIRLFANITGGHIIILSLIGLIWILGDYGNNLGGSIGGSVIAVFFVFVMNLLELFVALLQAFIFALLSALYIGDAVAEHHHDDEHHHEAAHA